MSGPTTTRVGDAGPAGPGAGSGWVRALAWSAVALEGYDLVVLGVVIPVLRRDPVFAASAASLTTVTTVGLLGVMVGALAVGPVSDLFGRRRTMIGCVVAFSVLAAACALSPNIAVLGLLRFVAGIPLGGVLPVALAMAAEHAPARRGSSATTILMTGYHMGAVAAALIGSFLVSTVGWEGMFAIGALPALLLVPLMASRLPADTAPVARDGERTRNPVGELFRGGYGVPTVAFWIASFMGLLLVYGLNTWLPEIMRSAGFPLTQALLQLFALNVGAVVGLLVAGRVADRIGIRPATMTWFGIAAVFLALLVLVVSVPGLLVYAALFVAGVFVFSSQVLVYAWVGRVYPAAIRGSALGSASGVGRLGAITGPAISGVLVGAGIAFPWGLLMFAVAAGLGAAAVSAITRTEPADDLVETPESAVAR